MIKVLFQVIPQMLFEPIAFISVLGLVCALICFYKKHGPYFWFFTISTAFMIAWRVFYPISSSRYAALLIYPALIAVAYFLVTLKDLRVLSFLKKYPGICKALPILLTVALAVACIGKAFHLNPYEDYIRSTCRAAGQDAKKFKRPLLLTAHSEYRRYQHYSGIPAAGWNVLDFDGRTPDYKSIAKQILRYAPQADVLYFLLDEPSEAEAIPQEKLQIDQGKWELIFRHYQNRQKKEELRVYRYIPEKK